MKTQQWSYFTSSCQVSQLDTAFETHPSHSTSYIRLSSYLLVTLNQENKVSPPILVFQLHTTLANLDLSKFSLSVLSTFIPLPFLIMGPSQLNVQIGSFLSFHACSLFLSFTVRKLLLFFLLFIVILSIWSYFTCIPHFNTKILFEELMCKLRKQHIGNGRTA